MNNNKLYALLKKIIEYLGENGEIKMDSDLCLEIIFDMVLIFFIGITVYKLSTKNRNLVSLIINKK